LALSIIKKITINVPSKFVNFYNQIISLHHFSDQKKIVKCNNGLLTAEFILEHKSIPSVFILTYYIIWSYNESNIVFSLLKFTHSNTNAGHVNLGFSALVNSD
jgi:hypothetical protein